VKAHGDGSLVRAWVMRYYRANKIKKDLAKAGVRQKLFMGINHRRPDNWP